MTVKELIRVLISCVVVGSGLSAIIIGVAIIYWPAALIAGGAFLVVIGAFLVNIPEPPKAPFPRAPGEVVE